MQVIIKTENVSAFFECASDLPVHGCSMSHPYPLMDKNGFTQGVIRRRNKDYVVMANVNGENISLITDDVLLVNDTLKDIGMRIHMKPCEVAMNYQKGEPRVPLYQLKVDDHFLYGDVVYRIMRMGTGCTTVVDPLFEIMDLRSDTLVYKASLKSAEMIVKSSESILV